MNPKFGALYHYDSIRKRNVLKKIQSLMAMVCKFICHAAKGRSICFGEND
jgi:hypothetical protein